MVSAIAKAPACGYTHLRRVGVVYPANVAHHRVNQGLIHPRPSAAAAPYHPDRSDPLNDESPHGPLQAATPARRTALLFPVSRRLSRCRSLGSLCGWKTPLLAAARTDVPPRKHRNGWHERRRQNPDRSCSAKAFLHESLSHRFSPIHHTMDRQQVNAPLRNWATCSLLSAGQNGKIKYKAMRIYQRYFSAETTYFISFFPAYPAASTAWPQTAARRGATSAASGFPAFIISTLHPTGA